MCVRIGFLIVLTSLLALGDAPSAQAAKKPNVLLLFADDMRADSIRALGNPILKTPTLDALVQRGFVFRNGYCLGGNAPAVCLPSRNMLLSGNAYFRWQGNYAPDTPPNFPLSMEAAGYETFHEGKRGNSALKIQAKFQINRYINEVAERENGEPGKEIADDAIAFLRGRSGDRPFFMYLAFANPHDPRVANESYMQQYQRERIPLPKNFLPLHPFNNGDMELRDERLSGWPRTPADIRRQLHEYYATITSLDGHMGRVLAALKELGEDQNTIVIFSADQGIAIGSHGLLGKQSLYDSHMKVPLVFAGPGIPQGGSDALVYLLDIYPTVCELVGAPAPQGIDGRSFRQVLAGKGQGPRRELFFAYREVQRALRDERYKLIRYPRVDVTQLFDLATDPDEMENLAFRPEHASRIAEMRERLELAARHYGDKLPWTVEPTQPARWSPPAEATTSK